MRMIAGEARGRTIVAPRGQDTRPTQDYVRESLFNILRETVVEARVLDLFAGSGALALEAVSRGAAEATLVDSASEAAQCIRKNMETLRFQERTRFLQADWRQALERLSREGRAYTLVFLDPPYRMTGTGSVCARLAYLGLLETDALVVIEHRREHVPTPDARFMETDARRYGDTAIHFYRYRGEAQRDAHEPVRVPGEL